jgi:hypothetical protein
MNTRSKRASACGMLLPFLLHPPLPDGTIDLGDKQHIAWSYSGIAAQGFAAINYRPPMVVNTDALAATMAVNSDALAAMMSLNTDAVPAAALPVNTDAV